MRFIEALALLMPLIGTVSGVEQGPQESPISGTKLNSIVKTTGSLWLYQGKLSLNISGEAVAEGKCYIFDPNAQLRTLINYDKNAKRDGQRIVFSDKGWMLLSESYKAGKLDGNCIYFDEVTGLVNEVRFYIDGKQIGKSTFFDAKGVALPGYTEEERQQIPKLGQ